MKKIILENGKEVEISDESYKALSEAVVERRWKPEYGKKYWFVNKYNNVEYVYWNDYYKTNNRFKINTEAEKNYYYKTNNCFKTNSEAERKKEIDNLIEAYRWYPTKEELEDGNIDKYYINVGISNKKLLLSKTYGCFTGQIAFKSEEDFNKVFDNITYDEYLKYILCVY